MPTAYHMVHYRRFAATNMQDDNHLESLCRTALGQVDGGASLWERVPDRLMDLGAADGRQLLLNRVADLTSAVFGELCLAQTKGMQALLELKTSKVQLSTVTTAEVYKLGERAAPQGSQFIRGMAYWIAIGNHLFFVKSQSMDTGHVVAYLNWLLTRHGVLPVGSTATYQAEFDRSQVGGDIGDVRSLRLSGKLVPQLTIMPDDAPEHDKVVKTSRRIAEKYSIFDQAADVAKAVFGEARARSLVESLGPEEYLSAQTDFKVQGKRTQKSRDALKTLANEVADMTDAKVQVEGRDGRVSDDDAILRTRMPFEVDSDGSNLLVFDNVADQLQVVYRRFVDDNKNCCCMILVITIVWVLVSAAAFGFGVDVRYLLACASSVITALSIITAAVFVRLNRGMPSLDWKGAPASSRENLTTAILQVTGEYGAIVAINGTFLLFSLYLVALGKDGACLFSAGGQKLLSSVFGGLAGTSLARMGYVVWRDYDIVRLQKALVDAAAVSELQQRESAAAASRLASMAKVNPQEPIRPQEWEA